MTVKNPPVWLEGGTYTAEHDRLVTSLLVDRTMSSNKTGLLALEGGVVPPFSQLQVTSQSNSMTLTISSGTVLIPRTNLDPPGMYVCHNQGLATVTFDAASGSPRIDVLVARVYDTTQGNAGNVWSLEAVKGTEAATPVAPPLTGSVVPIAQVRVVPAAQNGGVNKITTSQITDLRVFTSSLGGVHPVWGTHPNPVPSPGRLMYDVPNGSLYLGNGTNFNPLYTFNEMKAWLAKYRPDQVTHVDECSTTATDWDRFFRDDNTPTASTDPMPVALSGLSSPSGKFVAHLSLSGACSDADTTGYTSIEVKRSDNNTVVVDNFGARGPAFYTQSFHNGHTSTLLDTNVKDVNCTFTVFARVAAGSGRFSMRRIKLLVEPII